MLPTPIYLQILPSSDTGGAANLQRLFLKDPKADLYIVMK